MSKEMQEEKAQLYALGTLPDSERAAFEAEVRDDRELRELVHGYQKLMELDAPDEGPEPPFEAYTQVMQALDGEESLERPAALPDGGKGKLIPFLTWGGWAAAAACVAVLVGIGGFGSAEAGRRGSDIVVSDMANPRFVAVQTPDETFGVEDRMLELAGLAEAYWFSREGVPPGQLLKDPDGEERQLTGGFTVFDPQHDFGFIAVENLPVESTGKSYHVWAKTPDGRVTRAGSLPIGEESRGLFFFDVSDLSEGKSLESVSFFVTEEETDSPSSPSPMVVLSDF